MIVDRRGFVALTLGAATTAVVAGGAPGPTPDWRGALIINALGDLDDPNPPAGGDNSAQRAAVQGAEALVLNKRAISDALASGLTAINVTLGYVAGDMEPF
jgi:membrane dipeptidase